MARKVPAPDLLSSRRKAREGEDQDKGETVASLEAALGGQYITAADMGRCTLGLMYWPRCEFKTLLQPKAEYAIAKRWLDAIYEVVVPDLVVIEGYSFGSLWMAQRNAEVIGIVKWELDRNGTAYVCIPPTQVKKALTGKGRASKQEMIGMAQSLGFDVKTEHEADALGLLMAYARNTRNQDAREGSTTDGNG